MSSKQTKKPVKKTSNKKQPAKKAVAKKASTPKKTAIVRSEDAERLQAVSEAKQQFVSAEKLMKTIAEQPPVIRANDVKSLSLRKRMLAWFKISK